ncbi:MAG: FAD-dependent oxidoreductase [Chloroflexota bacterium]|nr:FAD-dependent oxidoreductase [Chloroflexota bacterium]
MKKSDVVVIGGSAAGIPAAVGCRRRYPEKKVTLIRKEEQALIPCGIPYIFGTLGGPEKNLIPDAILENNGIELIIDAAGEIDRENKAVLVASGEKVGYDKLILATGSLPLVLPIPGIDKENVFTVNKDVGYLKNMLDVINQAKDIVVLGGGFIGAEFADECKKNRDNNVTIVEMLPHCLQLAFDDELCIEAEKVLTERGIKILTNERIEAIVGDKKVSKVKLASGQELKADVVIVGVGAVPSTELAKKAGLRIGTSVRAILVDRYQRTTEDPDIFACGDCVAKVSFFSGRPTRIMLASIATGEARIAAANLFETRYLGLGGVGVFSTKLGDLALGAAGLIERQAREDGYNIVIGEATAPNRHPGGMPGAVSTKVRLMFSRDNGVILGGEASGGVCVGELVNVISACVQHRMTAYDVSLFQMGTHPALTASPMVYQLVNAAELAVKEMA